MRICYFYAQDFPEARAALPHYTEIIYTGNNDYAYWRAFSERWTGEDDLLVIEQDIVLNERVIPEFEICSRTWYRNWCVFPYKNFSAALSWDGKTIDHPGSGYLTHNLGCTLFSANLQRFVSIQDMLDNSPYTDSCGKCTKTLRCWCHIDFPVHDGFKAKGMTDENRHLHSGEVKTIKTGLEAPMKNEDSKLNGAPFGFWDL